MSKARDAKKRADVLFSIVVRARDGACVRCGSTRDLECAHVRPRRYSATRVDLDNAMALCHEHHAYYTAEPDEWEAFARSCLGPVYDEVYEKAERGGKVDWPAEVGRLRALVNGVKTQ